MANGVAFNGNYGKNSLNWKLENCNKLETLGEMDLDKIKRLFLSIDKSGSGKTSIYGLGSILEDPTLKMSKNAIAAFITEFDFNRNGTQEWDIYEFLNMIEVNNFSDRIYKGLIHKAIIRKSAIRNDFRKYDKNGDGYITTKHFRVVMRKQKIRVSEGEIDAMIQDADYDINGKMDYDEFALVMTDCCDKCFE